MEKSESITKVAAAMAKAQKEVGKAHKDKENPAFTRGTNRSMYANLESVWDACVSALSQNELSIIQMPCDSGEGRAGIETMLLHSSGEYIASKFSTRITKDDAQGLGSAITYLRRYSLAAMVGVVATEDDDGNAASAPPAAKSAPQRPTSRPAPKQEITAETLRDDKVFKSALKSVIEEKGLNPSPQSIKDTLAVDDFGLKDSDPATAGQNRLRFINGVKSGTIKFMEN